ncbi:hypothetical protein LR48_Vigan02g199600 [Vigna angularis]|uniref:Uncharacterized protein n=1 Tax=Phaseolus angularis TaxID=3914 RepID=A0A0L9TZA9_PHAAN|nr:hypothetical protein LR48_Vigan02g199600 [Vigna angularis]
MTERFTKGTTERASSSSAFPSAHIHADDHCNNKTDVQGRDNTRKYTGFIKTPNTERSILTQNEDERLERDRETNKEFRNKLGTHATRTWLALPKERTTKGKETYQFPEFETVQFKLKLGTPEVILQCRNVDRSREKVSYRREKGEFSREKKEKMKDQIFGKRVHAEDSGVDFLKIQVLLHTLKRTSPLQSTPVFH